MAREAKDIGVIVAARHFRLEFVMAIGSTHVTELIRRNRYADAAAADQYAAIDVSFGHVSGDDSGNIRIVHAFCIVGAFIRNVMTELLKNGEDPTLHLHAAMIASNRNAHS